MEGKIIQCRNCGKEFVRERNCQKYCSVQCRDEYYKKENRNLTNKYECKWCGKTFISDRKKKYCSAECRNKAQHPRKGPKKVKLSLAAINALARAEGLNYGQYVAKYGL